MIDVLAIGAHPDDVEFGVGGILARLAQQGKKVKIVDLTRGEIGTRGTPEIRKAEAEASARVLGVEDREILDLGDGQLQANLESRRAVIEIIRKHRPTIVIAPHVEDLHPDHASAGRIVSEAFYPSGFANYPAGGEAYRPRGVLFYQAHLRFDPSFVVDTSETFDKKMEAIRCYASQLHKEQDDEPQTGISHPEFLGRIEARDRYYGSLVGSKYGEPLRSLRLLRTDSPLDFF
ncbi:MAG: bacillithiol biosynthesis deacetylase BshB1 [Planctomycetota bacterium]|nr:bacillithiol biosynthesis deacetylase BshB1 [Planctomycetota bacterium]